MRSSSCACWAGLVLIFVPYTVSYWAGFTVIAASENLFELGQYGILFAASLPVGIGLFGINAFLFTRANTLFDGIVFMLVWIFVLILPFLWLESLGIDILYRLYGGDINWTAPINFLSYSPLICLFVDFSLRICGTGGGWAEAPSSTRWAPRLRLPRTSGSFGRRAGKRRKTSGRFRTAGSATARSSRPVCCARSSLSALTPPSNSQWPIPSSSLPGRSSILSTAAPSRLKLADLLCIVGALLVGTAINAFGREILAPWFDVLREQLREGALLAQALTLL